MRLVRILGNLCLSLLISLMAVLLSACLSEIANLREQSSLGGTKLAPFSLAVVRLQVFTGGRWKSEWMTLALLNNHSAPLWFHAPAVISVLVEPCRDVSGAKLGIEMARLFGDKWKLRLERCTYMKRATLLCKHQNLVSPQ